MDDGKRLQEELLSFFVGHERESERDRDGVAVVGEKERDTGRRGGIKGRGVIDFQ